MKLRIVDFIGNIGGGERFLIQMVSALLKISDNLEIELCGSVRSSSLFQRIKLIDPQRISISRLGAGRFLSDGMAVRFEKVAKLWAKIMRDFLRSGWTFDVPLEALQNSDVIWFPWAMRHRIPSGSFVPECKMFATYHDTSLIDIPGLVPNHLLLEEVETSRQWMASNCHLLFTSKNTLRMLEDRFGKRSNRWSLIRLAADHQVIEEKPDFQLLDQMPSRYVICPANISPHKNHEVLLKGLAPLKDDISLVLTGQGSDLTAASGRGKELANLARELGFKSGRSIFPLGYVSEATYAALLEKANLLVMPTLAEGGGSWPVFEALLLGKPVIVADIPVMREFADAFEVNSMTWFDPYEAESLTQAILNFTGALTPVDGPVANSKLNRSWAEVAKAHLELFEIK